MKNVINEQSVNPAIDGARITSKWLRGYIQDRGGAIYIAKDLVILG